MSRSRVPGLPLQSCWKPRAQPPRALDPAAGSRVRPAQSAILGDLDPFRSSDFRSFMKLRDHVGSWVIPSDSRIWRSQNPTQNPDSRSNSMKGQWRAWSFAPREWPMARRGMRSLAQPKRCCPSSIASARSAAAWAIQILRKYGKIYENMRVALWVAEKIAQSLTWFLNA